MTSDGNEITLVGSTATPVVSPEMQIQKKGLVSCVGSVARSFLTYLVDASVWLLAET